MKLTLTMMSVILLLLMINLAVVLLDTHHVSSNMLMTEAGRRELSSTLERHDSRFDHQLLQVLANQISRTSLPTEMLQADVAGLSAEGGKKTIR
jgi:hypothetical protein